MRPLGNCDSTTTMTDPNFVLGGHTWDVAVLVRSGIARSSRSNGVPSRPTSPRSRPSRRGRTPSLRRERRVPVAGVS